MTRSFSPLRYPGGKAALANYVKALLLRNKLIGCEYVEPYCGGAGVAMELLRLELVSSIRINDVDRSIASFWSSVLRDPDAFCRRVARVRLNIKEWRRQKEILANADLLDADDVGFAAFYLNRVNRSGILSAGPIGGIGQTGEWLMDARFNKDALIATLEEIGRFRDRIQVTNDDALKFLRRVNKLNPQETFCYLDPPYVVQGKRLYRNSYTEDDHVSVAQAVGKLRCPWIVSYDNVDLIHRLYVDHRHITYGIGYSANRRGMGSEIMIYSDDLAVPRIAEPANISERDWRVLATAA